MELATLKDSVTSAIRYWEPRRLIYNGVLAAIVLACFAYYYPASKMALSLDLFLFVFLLAVLANVAYCTAYIADVFAQMSRYRERWNRYRWVLFVIGLLFAGTITRFFSLAIFASSIR